MDEGTFSMKRDARIGLAVVLVLGLSVTLLVARALHSRANTLEAEGVAVAKQSGSSGANANATDTLDPSAAQAREQELRNFLDGHSSGLPNQSVVTNGNVRAEVLETASHEYSRPGAPLDPGARNSNLQQTRSVHPPAPSSWGYGWTYTAVAGDTSAKISAKVFGDERQAQKITAANPSLAFAQLKAGQKVHIPAVQGLRPRLPLPTTEGGAPAAGGERNGMNNQEWESYQAPLPNAGRAENPQAADSSAPATYKVKSGDTLAAIAKAHYGSSGPKSVQRILDANAGLDPKRLKIGANLKIPAPLP